MLRPFGRMAPREVNQFCQTCHNRSQHTEWDAGMHAARNVSCVDCHSIHRAKSEGGALKEAKRSLVYLRPNLILVYDKLASDSARQWEWNIHALNSMEVAGDRRITVRNGRSTLCVEMLAGPPVAFTQTDRFVAAPQGENMPPQWHGAFVTKERSTSTELVALMRVGCTTEPVTVTRASQGWSLKLAGKTVSLEEGRADVRPAQRAR